MAVMFTAPQLLSPTSGGSQAGRTQRYVLVAQSTGRPIRLRRHADRHHRVVQAVTGGFTPEEHAA